MVEVLVGGKKREDVLAKRKQDLEHLTEHSEHTPQSTNDPTLFSILDAGDYWEIVGVKCLSKWYRVDMKKDVFKEVNGLAKRFTRVTALDHNLREMNPPIATDGFCIASAAMYRSTLDSLYLNRNVEPYQTVIERARLGLQEVLDKGFIITSTVAIHPPDGKNRIHHDWKTPRHTEWDGFHPGRDDYLNLLTDGDLASMAIFECSAQQITTLTRWLHGDAYLSREPETDDHHRIIRTVGLGNNTTQNRFEVFAKGVETHQWRGLGMRWYGMSAPVEERR